MIMILGTKFENSMNICKIIHFECGGENQSIFEKFRHKLDMENIENWVQSVTVLCMYL